MKKHLILMTVAATLLTSCGGSKTTTAEAVAAGIAKAAFNSERAKI